jgi:hypothetical protein
MDTLTLFAHHTASDAKGSEKHDLQGICDAEFTQKRISPLTLHFLISRLPDVRSHRHFTMADSRTSIRWTESWHLAMRVRPMIFLWGRSESGSRGLSGGNFLWIFIDNLSFWRSPRSAMT